MSDELPIPAAAIEAAAKALHEAPPWADSALVARAALRVALAAMGATVDNDDGHNTMYRLVTEWMI